MDSQTVIIFESLVAPSAKGLMFRVGMFKFVLFKLGEVDEYARTLVTRVRRGLEFWVIVIV